MSEEMAADGMRDMYLYENTQLLEQLENTTLDKKDADSFDEADINEFFRVMHTIKGSSGVMMYDDIMKLSHKLEDVFYYIRESKPDNVPHMELVDHILAVSDFISGEFDKIRDGDDPDGDASELINEIDKFLKKIKNEITSSGDALPPENKQEKPVQFYVGPVAGEESNYYKIILYFRNDTEMCNIRCYTVVHAIKEAAEEMFYQPDDILTNEESAEVILEHGFKILLKTQKEKEEIEKLLDSSGVEKIEINSCTSQEFAGGFDVPAGVVEGKEIDLDSDLTVIETKAKEKKPPKPGDYVIENKKPGKPQQLAKPKDKAPAQSFISVNISKVDALMDLIGEIVIAESVVLQNPDLKVPGLSLNNFNKAAAQLVKFTSELQDVIMSMRMMPLTNTFQKMRRIVFDTSRKVGKDVDFVMIGENTEVDKSIIEHISDPLMHMIRNSVDHGVEEKEERIAAGKPEKGVITLEAKNESGKVWLIVKDDGAGMNPTKLFNKAKKNGIVPADKTEEDYTKKEIYQFITYPGFSTNEKVTEVSGRGVGMDVVVKNIQEVGGQLEIDSEEGKGSTMSLIIPLTLAIIDGIVMEVGNTTFVIETSSIKEFVNVRESNMIHGPDGEECVEVRGNYFPVVRLSDKYHIEGAKRDVSEGIMIVAEHERKKVCIFVDHLVGGQEIVVKPIPSYVKKVDGLSGCTQLGDGSIALILDVGGLV